MEPIDFVIIWVDGNDPKWQAEKRKYEKIDIYEKKDNREIRYRDWDNLQYWFRGVEKFAPWVHKIHFVTWGHIPKWLDITNPKVHIVNHKDIIPNEYLPVFNSNAIELNINKIEGLSEQFVYFNDDMFIVSPMQPTDFFINGLPVTRAILDPNVWDRAIQNYTTTVQMGIINDHFDKKKVIKENFSKWFNVKYGKENLKNVLLYPWSKFTGISTQHLPNPFLKSVLDEVWREEPTELLQTISHKFRTPFDINQWIFLFWEIVSGRFIVGPVIGKSFEISDNEETNLIIYNTLKAQNYKLMCLNDLVRFSDFEGEKKRLNRAFNSLLPLTSSFERSQ
ncbi:Stealth CR1 domain-containing protein [Lactococcus hircilactis]|uniref:Stealth CR1 domain-containing protein n=1 Tax=Lactococcus hircilactis TaxID=1494462 RepID=UPI003FA1FA1A